MAFPPPCQGQEREKLSYRPWALDSHQLRASKETPPKARAARLCSSQEAKGRTKVRGEGAAVERLAATKTGVGVSGGVGIAVGVDVAGVVLVAVGVWMAGLAGVAVGLGVAVSVAVAVGVKVAVLMGVAEGLGVAVGVAA